MARPDYITAGARKRATMPLAAFMALVVVSGAPGLGFYQELAAKTIETGVSQQHNIQSVGAGAIGSGIGSSLDLAVDPEETAALEEIDYKIEQPEIDSSLSRDGSYGVPAAQVSDMSPGAADPISEETKSRAALAHRKNVGEDSTQALRETAGRINRSDPAPILDRRFENSMRRGRLAEEPVPASVTPALHSLGLKLPAVSKPLVALGVSAGVAAALAGPLLGTSLGAEGSLGSSGAETEATGMMLSGGVVGIWVLWEQFKVAVNADSRRAYWSGVKEKWLHYAENGSVAFFSFALAVAPFAAAVAGFYNNLDTNHIGWLNGLVRDGVISAGVNIAASFVILDIFLYVLHIAYHRVPLMWRLHSVHHSDPRFDVTTSLRDHFLATILEMGIRLGIYSVLGPSWPAITCYEAAVLAFNSYQHAGIHFPRQMERLLGFFFITNFLHRIHHSTIVEETNSNYSTIFNWDRLFGWIFRKLGRPQWGTFKPAPDGKLVYGLVYSNDINKPIFSRVRDADSPLWRRILDLNMLPFITPPFLESSRDAKSSLWRRILLELKP